MTNDKMIDASIAPALGGRPGALSVPERSANSAARRRAADDDLRRRFPRRRPARTTAPRDLRAYPEPNDATNPIQYRRTEDQIRHSRVFAESLAFELQRSGTTTAKLIALIKNPNANAVDAFNENNHAPIPLTTSVSHVAGASAMAVVALRVGATRRSVDASPAGQDEPERERPHRRRRVAVYRPHGGANAGNVSEQHPAHICVVSVGVGGRRRARRDDLMEKANATARVNTTPPGAPASRTDATDDVRHARHNAATHETRANAPRWSNMTRRGVAREGLCALLRFLQVYD